MSFPRNLKNLNLGISAKTRAQPFRQVGLSSANTAQVVSHFNYPCKPSETTREERERERERMVDERISPPLSGESKSPRSSPAHPRAITASCTCPCLSAAAKPPALPLVQSRTTRDLSLTGPRIPAQTELPLGVRTIRPSPFVHDLSQYLKNSLSREETQESKTEEC